MPRKETSQRETTIGAIEARIKGEESDMNPKHLAIAMAVAAAALSPAARSQAADVNLGRNMAANCANCHGTNGASAGGMPALAGQPKDNLVRSLREFRDGKRPATIMHQLSKGYSDEQIELIAAFLAGQKAK
jgi:cytochrome c553